MNEILLEYYNIFTSGVEILAAVTGLIFYKDYKLTAAKYFIFFLVYLSLGDLFGNYVHFIKDGFLEFLHDTKFSWNYWWFTLFWDIGAIMFFSFYFRKILTSIIYKRIIKFIGLSFFLFSLFHIAFNWEQFFVGYYPLINVLGAIVIFLGSVFYFIEILESDKILTFYNSINFYITSAIFIWWLITTPLVFYEIYNFNLDKNFRLLKWQIYLFVNIFMYSIFIFALVWCRPERE